MIVAPGTTSQSLTIQIVDDGGLAVTGLIASTFPSVSYKIAGASAAVSITLSDLSLITSSYSSGGIKEISGGRYRLDLPNAALASAGHVTLIGEATGKRLIAPLIDVLAVSTYAGADTSGTTTLLSRLTATRAGYLDNIPAIFSQVEQLEFVDSRLNVNLTTIAGQAVNAASAVTFPATIGTSSYAGADTSGTTTLLTRIPSALTITTGKVDINDKTGFALSASGLSAISAWTVNLTGNLSGSVGSVVGNVGGNVVGSVGSLTGYTAPDNAGIAEANAKLDVLQEAVEAVGGDVTQNNYTFDDTETTLG